MDQRTIKETVNSGKSEYEPEEFYDGVGRGGEIAGVLDLLFVHAASFLSWTLCWGGEG